MFDARELDRALDLRQRGYRLLRWLIEAIDRGFVSFDAAHSYTTFPETAALWLDRHYLDLPIAARPAREDLRDFSRIFTSFLVASFDLVEQPGKRLYSPRAHCFCPCCSWLVAIPRLRPKRLRKADKLAARKLKQGWLIGLAFELKRDLSYAQADRAIDDPEQRVAISLGTYGADLLRRLAGESASPASLALWRGFAWTPQGSPIKEFELYAEDILAAERTMAARILAASA
jgi:hypothetical protein